MVLILNHGVVDPPAYSVAGRSRGCTADDSASEDEARFQSYDDTDDGEVPVPPFNPSGTSCFQIPGHYTRGSLTTAFFPDSMANNCAHEKFFSGIHSS